MMHKVEDLWRHVHAGFLSTLHSPPSLSLQSSSAVRLLPFVAFSVSSNFPNLAFLKLPSLSLPPRVEFALSADIITAKWEWVLPSISILQFASFLLACNAAKIKYCFLENSLGVEQKNSAGNFQAPSMCHISRIKFSCLLLCLALCPNSNLLL